MTPRKKNPVDGVYGKERAWNWKTKAEQETVSPYIRTDPEALHNKMELTLDYTSQNTQFGTTRIKAEERPEGPKGV